MKIILVHILFFLITISANSQKTVSAYYYTFGLQGDSTLSQIIKISTQADALSSVYEIYCLNDTTRRINLQNRTVHTFDSQGNIITEINYLRDSKTKQFVENIKNENTYYTNGKLKSSTRYFWNSEFRYWVSSTKDEYVYDASGNIQLYLRSYWHSNANRWVNFRKDEGEYDDIGNFIITEYSSPDGINWSEYYKSEIKYDALRQTEVTIRYYLTTGWIPYFLDTTIYDLNGMRTSISGYSRDTENQRWKGTSKYEYTYNDLKKLIFYQVSEWDAVISAWTATTRHDNLYDGDGNELLEIYTTNRNNIWVVTGKSYFSSGSSLLIYPKGDLYVYPNPFRDFLFIGVSQETGFARFDLFSLNGKKVFTSSEQIVDLSHLRNGFYILRMTGRDGAVTGTVKLLKQ